MKFGKGGGRGSKTPQKFWHHLWMSPYLFDVLLHYFLSEQSKASSSHKAWSIWSWMTHKGCWLCKKEKCLLEIVAGSLAASKVPPATTTPHVSTYATYVFARADFVIFDACKTYERYHENFLNKGLDRNKTLYCLHMYNYLYSQLDFHMPIPLSL